MGQDSLNIFRLRIGIGGVCRVTKKNRRASIQFQADLSKSQPYDASNLSIAGPTYLGPIAQASDLAKASCLAWGLARIF